jgi:3-(3-hydroxy-phenyl)propionate hydroxylase
MTRAGIPDWLLSHLTGPGFSLLVFGPATPDVPGVATVRIAPDALHDVSGLAAQRYGAPPGACVLLRPDQHVAALFRRFDRDRVLAAVAHAMGHATPARLERVA